MCEMGRRIESKPVSLANQNDPKQNYSSPASFKYKPRELIAENNKVYGTISLSLKIFENNCYFFYDMKFQ